MVVFIEPELYLIASCHENPSNNLWIEISKAVIFPSIYPFHGFSILFFFGFADEKKLKGSALYT